VQALLGEHPCTEAFKPLRQATSFARCRTISRSWRTRGWGDPALGQPTHAQQIR
jgi:hypothetical protein